MTANQVNYLNIGLMLFAALLAFILPFELFLFSYAVLGPLHYLTEISWLHKQSYFVPSKRDVWILIAACVGVTSINLILTPLFNHPEWLQAASTDGLLQQWWRAFLTNLQTDFMQWLNILMLFGFLSALAMLLFRNTIHKMGFLLLALIVSLVFKDSQQAFVLLGVLLPTLIHVFVFTGLFILYGALKSRSQSALLSLGSFVGCACSVFVIQPEFNLSSLTGYIERAMNESGFANVNAILMQLFHMDDAGPGAVFSSISGISVMRFVAFAYTYHYLNWFSKTSIIKWHQVNKRWLVLSGFIWVISIALYAYDYIIGLKALFLLSMLHVFLEFPLNFKTILSIGQESLVLTGLRKA
jgi:hypothetical protein